jgi:hypothetical protein
MSGNVRVPTRRSLWCRSTSKAVFGDKCASRGSVDVGEFGIGSGAPRVHLEANRRPAGPSPPDHQGETHDHQYQVAHREDAPGGRSGPRRVGFCRWYCWRSAGVGPESVGASASASSASAPRVPGARCYAGASWLRRSALLFARSTLTGSRATPPRGLSARIGADQLGHARPSMTQDVYMSRGQVHTEVADVLDKAGRYKRRITVKYR